MSHYRIESELGRGGMGVVYRAYDERLQRAVAIKVLTEEIAADPIRRHSILDEARASSALTHPAIITIHEVGEEGPTLFIVMELAAGRTLRRRLAEGPLDALDAARVGSQIADALCAAHLRGVVHGDVKPENVMLQPDNRLKLLDFGIARRLTTNTAAITGVLDAGAAAHSPITPSGTLPYMAPELLQGADGDARSDLYSLGVLLYEAVAGQRPFATGDDRSLVHDVISEAPTPLFVLAPAAPAEFTVIVHRLLAKRPADRYQSAADAAADLGRLARALEIAALLPPALAGKRAVAVLPFTLLTPNADDDYLSAALADALINHLSTETTFLVRPISTVMRYGHRGIDALAAGRELNVDVVVDGSVQRSAHRLRVHVQSRSVQDGSTLASARHESDAVDLFGLQDAVANTVMRSLGGTVKPAETHKPALPQNPAAYELYLRAGDRLSRVNRWDVRTAIDMLESATTMAPRFAEAWARLAEARTVMGVIFGPAGAWLPAAQMAVRRALALDRHNAHALSARGRLLWTPAHGFKNRLALRALATALRLNPSCHDALVWQGLIFYHVGMTSHAQASLNAALAANPQDGFAHTFLAQTVLFSGDYDGAEDITQRVLAADPSNLYSNLFAPMSALYRNDFDAMTVRVKHAIQIVGPDPLLESYLALGHAKGGDQRKARRMAAAVLRTRSRLHSHHAVHMVAAISAILDDKARAVSLLKTAARTGFPHYDLFWNDPHFRSLRTYPPFVRLIEVIKREGRSYEREFGAPSLRESRVRERTSY